VSDSPLIQEIADRLRAAGYVDVATPFRVATVSFDFTAALRGRGGRALDLVLLIDTTTGDYGDRDATQVRQRVEALSRALDVTGSRFLVTVILAGAALSGDIEALSATCRVLDVEGLPVNATGRPGDSEAGHQLDDRIRLLLPLELPPMALTQDATGSPVHILMNTLPVGVDARLRDAVVAASLEGEAAVTEALARVLGDATVIEDEA
jgi:hypothetical protein